MGLQFESVSRVLRAQLTAVNQQFVHILALRQWGLHDTAERILQVDRVDFPVAMKLIDQLAAAATTVHLEPDQFVPGSDEVAVLEAEQAVEQRLLSALLNAQISQHHPATRLISAAMVPRQAYADWLAARLLSLDRRARPVPVPDYELAEVFTYLIAMLEQSMAHAFVHWHHGESANADAAWATSGAAMMHATKIVNRLAAEQAVPIPNAALPLEVSGDPDDAIARERQLASNCADRAAATAERKCGFVGEACHAIAELAGRLSTWEPGQDHPASSANPAAFRSFEATLAKFVWS
jgi:bacterioferritin (cytochrome b1)